MRQNKNGSLPRRALSAAAVALVLSVLVTSAARAAVIGFQALEHGGTGQQVVPGTGKFYSEAGYDFTSDAPVHNLATWGTASGNYFGSTALWNGDGTGVTGITRLTRTDGGAFDLLSIDIAELNLAGAGIAGVTFEAVFSGGGTTSANFTTDGDRTTGDLSSFQTFAFTGFTDIVSVSWLQVTPFIQFDNVTVHNAADIPEPRAVALFLAAAVLTLALAGRRRAPRRRTADRS